MLKKNFAFATVENMADMNSKTNTKSSFSKALVPEKRVAISVEQQSVLLGKLESLGLQWKKLRNSWNLYLAQTLVYCEFVKWNETADALER